MTMIIIPDVHGRDFWMKPVEESLGEEHILFLGDYLDHYEGEWVRREDVFPRFEKILQLKREHPDDVTLLLGNHDLHYVERRLDGGRFDILHAARNKAAFLDNAALFQIAYEMTVGGTRVLFTHAGVQLAWLAKHKDMLDLAHAVNIADCLNKLWWDETRRPDLLKALGDVPYSRWGNCRYGSPIWNDVDDFAEGKEELPGYVQIFGHSQQEYAPVITDYYACLDCRRAFRLTEEGIIQEYDLGSCDES